MKQCDIETELLIPGCCLVILGLGGNLYRAEIKSGWIYSNALYTTVQIELYRPYYICCNGQYMYGGPLSRVSAAIG